MRISKLLLLDIDLSNPPLILLSIVLFLIGVFITRWIFQLDSIIKNLKGTHEEMIKLNEGINKLNDVHLAQLDLSASIANKLGVEVKEINDITEKYGIKFDE